MYNLDLHSLVYEGKKKEDDEVLHRLKVCCGSLLRIRMRTSFFRHSGSVAICRLGLEEMQESSMIIVFRSPCYRKICFLLLLFGG